ncbi:uncharacterized protein LOC132562382 [Ylistrum balloti]|uniref:uncharacterized protein LOC132562382 n=1 Tax=Ylistrum balloti TaxID=509963 RepID=UPI002905BB5F|nr:uncharacterized protein LOC132562382 [Ylistrum balloti]
MEKVSRFEISPMVALLNMIKVNYFGKTEVYKALLAVLCDYDRRNPLIKEKTKHYIQLLLADHQDLARSLITFLPGEENAENIPLGLSPITDTPAVTHKRHKKNRPKGKKKNKPKSRKSNLLNGMLLETMPSDLATPPKHFDKKMIDITAGTPILDIKSVTSEMSTPSMKELVLPQSSLQTEVYTTQNMKYKCCSEVIDSERVRSKSPIFSNSSRKPVVFTTAVYNESKCYAAPFPIYDSCGFPLKNLCRPGQKFSPLVGHKHTCSNVADIGTHLTLKSISQSGTAEANLSEVPTVTSMIPGIKPGNSCHGLPLSVQPYLGASRMMPLYNLSRNGSHTSNQAPYSASSYEPNMNSGLESWPLSNCNSVPLVQGTESTPLGPITLPYKAYTNNTNLHQNLIHRPETLVMGPTPTVYNPMQWPTRFEQFTTMTVGRTFHHSPASCLKPPSVAQLPCSASQTSHTAPVPHLYTLPKSSAPVSTISSWIEQSISRQALAKSPSQYTMAQMSHSAGKKTFVGTNTNNLSSFPYTKQMILPDGQTQNLYLKPSSIHASDINTVPDVDDHQKGIATISYNHNKEEKNNNNISFQNARDVTNCVPVNVSAGYSTMLQQVGDATQSLQSSLPFFITDHHLSIYQHPDNIVDSFGGRGDADSTKPRKVTMSTNSSVRKKLRLTPKCSKHQENGVLFGTE